MRSHTINKTSKMAGTREFLSVLRRVGISLSNGKLQSLNFKPLQVKCFESILKGQDVIGVLPTGSGKSMLFHDCTVLATIKATKYKANPAANEVRVKNRNHGLAQSQRSNNKTVQTPLSLIQKLLPRKEIRAPVKRLKLSGFRTKIKAQVKDLAHLLTLTTAALTRACWEFALFQFSIYWDYSLLPT